MTNRRYQEASNGYLYHTNGLNPVKRWNGRSASQGDAGMEGPSTALVIASSGDGVLVGTYAAYVRFLDADGLVTNLSPISNEITPSTATGIVASATNANPVVIGNVAHGLSTGDTVKVSGVEGNTAANASTTVTVIDADSFSLDGVVGNGDYTQGGVWHQGVQKFTYSSVPVSSDSRVTKRQILRNLDGNSAVYYVDIETTDLVATTFETTKADTTLSTNASVALRSASGRDLAISRHTPPRDDRVAIAHVLGRMFLGGIREYSVGAVQVTNSSTTVTGIGTAWTSAMVGRFLSIRGDTVDYEITAVNTSAQTLTIASYAGTTKPYESYSIAPAENTRHTVYWSEAGLPESWPPASGVSLEIDERDGDITGFLELSSRLYVIQELRTRTYSFASDPASGAAGGDGQVFPRSYRGAVNQDCIALIDGTAYMLDQDGVHAFDGRSDSPVSSPIQGLFGCRPNLPYRIHWEHKLRFHSVIDPGSELVRWFVCLDGSRFPRHAICFDYRGQRWHIEEYPHFISCSELTQNGTVLLGSSAGKIYKLDASRGDVASTVVRSTVTSSGMTSLTDSSASFSGVVGSPVSIVAGKGRGQQRVIVSSTSTKASIDRPWSSKPDATSVYSIGGIQWLWKGGVFSLPPEHGRSMQAFTSSTEKSNSIDSRLLPDRLTEPLKWGHDIDMDGVSSNGNSGVWSMDLMKLSGFFEFVFDASGAPNYDRTRYLQPELSGCSGDEEIEVYEVFLRGMQ